MTRPPEISINGVLTFYSLRYHRIGVDDFVFETADADLESTSLDQLHNHTLYEVFIAATTINGTGPFASQTAQTSENGTALYIILTECLSLREQNYQAIKAQLI